MTSPEARLYRADHNNRSVIEIYPEKGERIEGPEASRIIRTADYRCHVFPTGDIEYGNVCVVVDHRTYRELPNNIDMRNLSPEERIKAIAEDLKKRQQGNKPLVTGVIF